MIIIKIVLLLLVLVISFYIGLLYSKKFTKREEDLIEIRNGLEMFKNKIKFTLEPISEVFDEISNSLKPNIKSFFKDASIYMKETNAKEAWIKSINKNKENTNLNKEDVEKISNLSKSLGLTDIEGQVNNIEFFICLINEQIKKADLEKQKNQKLYKTLGTSVGLIISIILL